MRTLRVLSRNDSLSVHNSTWSKKQLIGCEIMGLGDSGDVSSVYSNSESKIGVDLQNAYI